MKLYFKSIRVKLIVSMLLLCLIPLTAVGIVSYSQAKSVLTKKLKTTSAQTLKEINGSLDNYFIGIDIQLTQASKNVNFSQIDKSEGREVFTQGYLGDMQQSSSDIINAFFATESGKLLTYPASGSSEDANYKTSDWYTLAIKNKGKAVSTEPHLDKSTGKAVITVVKTVEYDGQVVGVVGMDMSLSSISSIFSKSKVGDSGYIFISDHNGIIISHPDASVIGTDAAAKLSIWNEVNSNDEGFVEYEYQGQKKFGVYDTQTLTGWKLVAALDESELTKDVNAIRIVIIVSILIVAVIGLFVSLLISNGIGKNINKLKSGFHRAAEGDLTASVAIKSKDEIGQLGEDFNAMISNLLEIMVKVFASSETITESSTQIASMATETSSAIGEVSRAVDEISSGATNQSQSAQTSAENMESFSAMLDDVIGLTNEVGTIASDTEKLSENGLKLMNILSDKSEQTKKSSINVNNIVRDVNDSIAQINTISDTISNITEQTNLLSLNASIEAARAGESGRGFAVVADEIRKLAEQSKNSTQEIQKIIETVRSKSEVAVNAMDNTGIIIQEQDNAMIEARKTFAEIIKGIASLTGKIHEINNSTSNIGASKENVVDQIQSISAISQETASSTEEVSASTEEVNATMEELTSHAEQLQSLAEQLQEAVNKFKLQ